MSFPNLSDLVATTIEARSSAIADNVTQHNGLLTALEKQGNIKTFDGGTTIVEAFSYGLNANAGSYSGYDTLPTQASDNVSAATYNWSQYAVPVTFSGREQLTNSGKAQIIDLVEARVNVAESTMKNLLNTHLYLDGTGNNGKNLTGLAAAVPLSATNVYGGIDRSIADNAFWRNKKFQASVDGTGVAATGADLIKYWNLYITSLTRGTDRPDMIVASPALYALFQTGLQVQQRFTSADSANSGFQALMFQGIPVVLDTAASGIGTNTAYFLNTKYLKWRPHKDRNFVALDDKSSINQDATVKTLVWAGNLTCSGAQFQGVFSNT